MAKQSAFIGAAIFLLALLTGGLLFMHRLETGGDNLEYLIQARSVQAGQWGEALQWHRPPAYAACLAVLLRGAGIELGGKLYAVPTAGFYLAGVFNVVLFALTAVIVRAWLLRLGADRAVAAGAAILLAVNQIVAAFSSVISAEYLLILLSVIALWAWEGTSAQSGGSRWLWPAVICAALAVTAKYQGIALAAAMVFWILLKNRKPAFLAAAGALALFILLALFHQHAASPQWLGRLMTDRPYGTGEVMTWKMRVTSYLATYFSFWVNLFVPKVVDTHDLLARLGLGALTWPLIIVVDIVAAIGFVQTVRRAGFSLGHLYFAVYAVMLMAWPDREERYLLPLAPFVFWFTLEGFWWLCSKLAAAIRRSAVPAPPRTFATLVTLLFLWSVATNVFAGVKNWKNIIAFRHLPPWAPERYVISREDDFGDYMSAGVWLKDHVPADAVIYCRKAPFTELASRLDCVYYSAYRDPEALWKAVAADAAERPCYILNDSFSAGGTYGKIRELRLRPALEQHADRLEKVHETGGGSVIYRVRPDRGG